MRQSETKRQKSTRFFVDILSMIFNEGNVQISDMEGEVARRAKVIEFPTNGLLIPHGVVHVGRNVEC